jgi:hypothetical protein
MEGLRNPKKPVRMAEKQTRAGGVEVDFGDKFNRTWWWTACGDGWKG